MIKIKVGFFYSVFDNTELLEGSIKQIVDQVDEILIIYQNISNTGEQIYIEDALNIGHLRAKFSVIKYEPDLSLNIKENERRKHNLGIQYFKQKGFTHFVMGACDHYYQPIEFYYAKQKALEYDVTLTNMYTYFKNPEWQLIPIESYQMPFICRIYPNTEMHNLEYRGFVTDPSVRINTRDKIYCFTPSEIMLHHYSMVRTDIERKFKSAAIFNRNEEQINLYIDQFNNYDIELNPGVEYFGGRKIKSVPNYFGIRF